MRFEPGISKCKSKCYCYAVLLSHKFLVQGLKHIHSHDRGCFVYHIKQYFLESHIVSLCLFLVMDLTVNIRLHHWT